MPFSPLQASMAAQRARVALVLIDVEGRPFLAAAQSPLVDHARRLADHYIHSAAVLGLLHCFERRLFVSRIDTAHVGDPEAAYCLLDAETMAGRIPRRLAVAIGRQARLKSSHGGHEVVQNDDRDVVVGLDGIGQRRQTAVEKCRVSNVSDGALARCAGDAAGLADR